jgi:hypothetical protein
MKVRSCGSEKSRAAHDILAYLIENPGAQDTLDGIVQWWLLEQRIRGQTAEVKEALAELVAKKFVLVRKGKDSRTHYRLNRSKQGEIRAFLERRLY